MHTRTYNDKLKTKINNVTSRIFHIKPIALKCFQIFPKPPPAECASHKLHRRNAAALYIFPSRTPYSC